MTMRDKLDQALARVRELEKLKLTNWKNLHDTVKLDLQSALERIRELEKPRPELLTCPGCGERHIDEGEFAVKAHHTHACQHCGMVWRQTIEPSVGVRFLPGFKNG